MIPLILLLITLASILALAVFIERLLCLRRAEIDTHQFVILLRPILREGNIVEAMQICEQTGGSIAHIIKHGLNHHHRGRAEIEAAMERSGLVEIARLEKNSRLLSVVAQITPLLGLLGCMVGFIAVFNEMRATGLIDITTQAIGEAMEYSFISVAAGLSVAIPCLIAYNYIVSRVQRFVLEMQATSSEIVDVLVHRHEI